MVLYLYEQFKSEQLNLGREQRDLKLTQDQDVLMSPPPRKKEKTNFDRVQHIVMEDRRLIINQIVLLAYCVRELHNEPDMTKLSDPYVPHLLTPDQKRTG